MFSKSLKEIQNQFEITEEKLAKLDSSQKEIVLKREEKRKERFKLIEKVGDDVEVNQQVFNALLNMDRDFCEHDKSIWLSCASCEEIDKLLFPELFDVNYKEEL